MTSKAGRIVAVVDDDTTVLESLEDLLESAGYVARVFSSAAGLLESDVLPVIDCVISDICMPVMDGWELEAAVFGLRPDLPVILITGDDAARRESLLTRPNVRRRPLFAKPHDAQELLTAVGAAIERLSG